MPSLNTWVMKAAGTGNIIPEQKGVFPAGEAAATHGVYKPGEDALIAEQVGSYMAASFIAGKRDNINIDLSVWEHILRETMPGIIAITEKAIWNSSIDESVHTSVKNMGIHGAAFRDPEKNPGQEK